MIFNDFYNHFSNVNAKKTNSLIETHFKTFTNQVKSFIIEEGIGFDELTNDALSKLFNHKDKIDKFFKTKLTAKSKISMSGFKRAKKYLLILLLWFKANDLCNIDDDVIDYVKCYEFNNIMTSDFFVSYFKNLNDVIDFIDLIGTAQFKAAKKKNKNVETYNPSRDLLAIKSICILLWHGLSLGEIANIKKSDLKSLNDYYYVEYDGKQVKISYSQFKILSNLRDSIGEHPISRPLNFTHYMDGDTLFRKKHDFIDGETTKHRMKSLSHTITGFNKVATKLNSSKLLDAKNLKVNAYFATAYANISNFSKNAVTRYFYNNYRDPSLARDYILQFTQWIKIFHNIEIK